MERQGPAAPAASVMRPNANDESFEALAVPEMEAVYRVARRLARSDDVAQDLVQETYLKAYRAFGRYEVREFGIKPWLFRILHNTFLNRQARQQRAPRATDQQNLEQLHADPKSQGGVGGLDLEHLDEEVKQAIDSLSDEFRSVVLLWATMEYSYQEIAEILEIPIGTVMSRLHRARQQLARALEAYAREHRLTPGDDRP